MKKFKAWEDLTITDDFMFSQVMKDEEICKEVVEIILGIKVGKIEFLTSQHEIEINPEVKSITLDVYLRDEKKVINVELQNGHRLELPKRSRFYGIYKNQVQQNKKKLHSMNKLNNYHIKEEIQNHEVVSSFCCT